MKKTINRKRIIAIAITILLASSVLTYASTGQRTLTANYNNIKIVVDGTEITPTDATGKTVEPFAVDGTTYLPVRAVAAALGKEVSWDGKTQTVYIGAKPGEANYSRTNPAPLGVTQTLEVKSYFDEYTVNIKITEIIDGDAAWQKIKEANMLNDQAPAGKKYIAAKIEATVTRIGNDKAVSFSSYDFDAFNATNTEYESPWVVNPSPEFRGNVYAGGTLSGWVTFMVDASDTAPKCVYGVSYDGSGGIWFSLKR